MKRLISFILSTLFIFAFIPVSSAADISVSNENQLRAAISQAGNIPTSISLTADIELVSNFEIPTDADITLRSAGLTMYKLIATRDMDVITIRADAKLTIENIEITRTPGTEGSGIINNNSTLIMNSGTISGHSSSTSDLGGGVGSSGTFTMNGGYIGGNSSSSFWCAGGVSVFGGTFTMNGGTIADNEGGCVSYAGSVIINDGLINGRVYSPGGVRSWDNKFTMNKGTINGNVLHESLHYPMTINDGTINGNISSGTLDIKNGTLNGHVQIGSGTMHNGTIIGHVILDGIGADGKRTFTMNDGTIKGSASNGVSINGLFNQEFIMNGGTITENNGAGVPIDGTISGASFTFNGGKITKNNGGGVSIEVSSTFTMSGGSIMGNIASENGGGVNTSGSFTMSGGMIYNNTAIECGGVYHASGTFSFEGGWIWNNGIDISIAQTGTYNNSVYDVNIGAIGSPPPDFPNLSKAGSWARESIKSAVSKGFVPIDLQDNYTDAITRLDFCRLAVRYMEYATGKTIDEILTERGLQRDYNAFTDLTNTDVLAAYALGITSGTGGGKFSPYAEFTRESAAGMIMNLQRALGYDVSNPPPSGFSDAAQISTWTKAGVDYCVSAGIMSGSGGMFNPKGTFTREMSIMTFDNMN